MDVNSDQLNLNLTDIIATVNKILFEIKDFNGVNKSS
jgi:hypothetical protein